MASLFDDIIDALYDIITGKSTVSTNSTIVDVGNVASKVFSSIVSTLSEEISTLPAVVNVDKNPKDVDVEYVSYEGDMSELITERLELDENYPIIRLSESKEGDNIFGKAVFNFRKNGPKFGCDVRLAPYYRIPDYWYNDKWGEEIITFTDVLAGIVPLVEKARKVARDPGMYFGIKIYNDPDNFMLGSLDHDFKMTSDVLITVSNGRYDISWRVES